jgi:putative Mg2+ transporter-C (MgtC) family protein
VVDGMLALHWYDVVFRLGLAALLGAAIGFEREVDGHEAGLRTHLLLSLGSAVFGVTSVGAFDAFATGDPTNVRVDVTRIASYVAAGVGFIGGGAIIKHAGMVTGITTATSLWCAAAVGLSAGLGFWYAGVTATVIALFALAGLRPLNRLAARIARGRADALVIQLQPGADLTDVVRLLGELGRRNVKQLVVGSGEEEGATEIRAEFWESPDAGVVSLLIDRLSQEQSIRSVHHEGGG